MYDIMLILITGLIIKIMIHLYQWLDCQNLKHKKPQTGVFYEIKSVDEQKPLNFLVFSWGENLAAVHTHTARICVSRTMFSIRRS